MTGTTAFGSPGGLLGPSPFSSIPFGANNLLNNQNVPNNSIFGQTNQPKPFEWNTNTSALFPNNSSVAFPGTVTATQPSLWNPNIPNLNSNPFSSGTTTNTNNAFNNTSSTSTPHSAWNFNQNSAVGQNQFGQPSITCQQTDNAFSPSTSGYSFLNSTLPASFGSSVNSSIIPLTTPFGTGLCHFQTACWPTAASHMHPSQGTASILPEKVSNSSDIHTYDYKDKVLRRDGIICPDPTWKDWEILKHRLKRDVGEADADYRRKTMQMHYSNDCNSGLHQDKKRRFPNTVNNSFGFQKVTPKSGAGHPDNSVYQKKSKPDILDENRHVAASWKKINSSAINEREFSVLKQNNRRSLLDVSDSEFISSAGHSTPYARKKQTGPPKIAYPKLLLSNGVTVIPECVRKSLGSPLQEKSSHLVGNLPRRFDFHEKTSNETARIHQEFRPIPVNISSDTTGLPANCGEGDYLPSVLAGDGSSSLMHCSRTRCSHEGRTLRCPAQTMRLQQKTVHSHLRNCGVKLTMDDCYCSPDIATLDTKVDSVNQICLVKNFEVGHNQYGKAVFDGIIDVFGINLDEIVKFSPMAVGIYPEGISKPPFGEKLNCPVTITLYNTYPKINGIPITDRITLSTMRFDQTLIAACEQFNAIYVSYNMENGDWVFKAQQKSDHTTQL